MAEIFPGSGLKGKPPKPKSLSETFEEIKDIAKGVGIGESFDLAGAPADITDAFFSARKALFPYSDLGEQKAAEKLAQGIGAEALIKKAGVDVPEFGNNLESFGRTIAPGLLIGKTAAGVKLLSRMYEGGPPPTALAPAGVNDPILMDIPKTTGEKLAMTSANRGIGDNKPPKKGPKNFQEAGEKHVQKEELPPFTAFRGAEVENKSKNFVREKEDALPGFDATQQFFSPTSYFFENSAGLIGFGRKPMKGGDILNRLLTNNNVPRAVKRELRSLGLDNFLLRNSEKPFTRDEFLGLLTSVKPQIRVETFSRANDLGKTFPDVYFKYRTTQRSSLSYNNEQDYGWMVFSDKNSNAFGTADDAELVVKNDKTSTGVSGHDYAGKQDESPGYFGHIRYSIQEIDGELALVPEEIQSDAVRNSETISKVMTGSLPVQQTPARQVSDADRKNLDRARPYIAEEFRNLPFNEQDGFLDNVKDTDRHATLTKYGGSEEALIIKQAQDLLSDGERAEIRNFSLDKKDAFKNRRITGEKLQKAEADVTDHENNRAEIGLATDFLDSVEDSVEQQKKFINRLNEYTDELGFNAMESAIAPSDALKKGLNVFGLLGKTKRQLLLDSVEMPFDIRLFSFLGAGVRSNLSKFIRGQDFKTPRRPSDITPNNVYLDPNHLKVFDAGYDKTRLVIGNIFEETFGKFNQQPYFTENVRLLDPDYKAGFYAYDIPQLQKIAIDADPDTYVDKMKQFLTKELTNKTEVELTTARFLKNLYQDSKFMKEFERSKDRLSFLEKKEGGSGGVLSTEDVSEMQDILDDIVETSFTDKALNNLAYKIVDDSYNRTGFFPKYSRSSGTAPTDLNDIATRTEEQRDVMYDALTPFVKRIFANNPSKLSSWNNAKGSKFYSHIFADQGDVERLLEQELKNNRKLQRDLAALELKDAVLGQTKTGFQAISGQYSTGRNGYYLGMRGQNMKKGGLHAALGKFDYRDFEKVKEFLQKNKNKAEDKAQEADRVISENFNDAKIKESYKVLVDKADDKELVKKTLEKIIDYDLGVPGAELKKQPPFKSMEDFSKFAIRSAVREAHKLGLKKIIVPTAQNYVGESKVTAIGTYNKAPKEALQEYVKHGGKLTTRKLPEIGYNVEDSNVLDISEIDDKFFTGTSASLFNKGGIVRKAS